jgi:Skp family chaperone for outer membrane proteins
MRNLTIFAALAASTLAVPAQAQRLPAAVIAVVDTQRIYRECTACRSAQGQLQTQATSLQQRRQTLASSLQTEGQQLQQAVQALSGRQPDAALRQRIQAFEQKQTQANQELAQAQQRFQSIQANILRQINERLDPIVSQVMTARGATVALSTEATLAHAQAVDVTNDVLARLNQALPAVSATPLPQQQQQQQTQPPGR